MQLRHKTEITDKIGNTGNTVKTGKTGIYGENWWGGMESKLFSRLCLEKLKIEAERCGVGWGGVEDLFDLVVRFFVKIVWGK